MAAPGRLIGLRVTWEKRYITRPGRDHPGLAFKVFWTRNHLLSEEEERGISLALIPTETRV